uniref:uncharacterized protein LOC108950931 isoform X3 n=1 Tax=Ciona intestinalis TaxID=7719 RepID=UPI000EF4EE68|nr:uncharacterized protein LOC108950931 isoform X3 [Ciona intestinalis]|eukprot:XP_026696064.1 uncharacterized protein LOC108950931 isoform X3 [Ciona intestinalis]
MITKIFTLWLLNLYTTQHYVQGYVELANGIMYEVVTDLKNFNDAEAYCRNLDGLLLYSITSTSVQNALSNAITSNLTWNAHSSYWIGLDDTITEATCQHQPNIGPTGTRTDIPALDCPVSCPAFQDCINKVCRCNVIFKEDSRNCDESSGITATHEEVLDGKTYLFFKEQARYTEASDFCKDTWGRLAMPKSKVVNDFIYTKARMHLLAFDSTVWIGLLQTNPQNFYEKDEWAFSDYESVNLPPEFGDMTVGGELPLYTYNFTTLTERWHFFYFATEPWYNRQEAIDHCALTGSHFPYLLHKSEHDRLIELLKVS